MTNIAASVPKLDRVIHEPARLAILSALSGVDRADFNYLLVALGLSRGNLSSHMNKLSDAGYVTVKKQFVGNMPNTSYILTNHGKTALDGYWNELDALRTEARAMPGASLAQSATSHEEASGGD